MQHRENLAACRGRIHRDLNIAVDARTQRRMTDHRAGVAFVVGMNRQPAGRINHRLRDSQRIAFQRALVGDDGRGVDREGQHLIVNPHRAIRALHRAKFILAHSAGIDMQHGPQHQRRLVHIQRHRDIRVQPGADRRKARHRAGAAVRVGMDHQPAILFCQHGPRHHHRGFAFNGHRIAGDDDLIADAHVRHRRDGSHRHPVIDAHRAIRALHRAKFILAHSAGIDMQHGPQHQRRLVHIQRHRDIRVQPGADRRKARHRAGAAVRIGMDDQEAIRLCHHRPNRDGAIIPQRLIAGRDDVHIKRRGNHVVAGIAHRAIRAFYCAKLIHANLAGIGVQHGEQSRRRLGGVN